jgi:hypothetical protein
MNEDAYAALVTEKSKRAEAATAAADLAIRLSAAVLHFEADRAEITALRTLRAAAVAANRPNEVADCDAKLLRANIAVEISESQASTLRAQHAAAVAALRASEAAVSESAGRVLDFEMLALASKFTAALDAAMVLGAELEAMRTLRPVPAEVTAALAKIPQPDPLHVPINILRNGRAHDGELWRQRHAQLTAVEEVSA